MKFYLDKIEQVKTDVEGELNEYGSRTKYGDEQSARTDFYKTLMNVSNSAAHVYLDIKIVNSDGGIIKKDSIGSYVDTE